MAIDHRMGSKVGKNFRREEAPATRVEPYPYIGIVKNNIDPTRSGRLQVWVPDFGGDPDEPKFWRTVSYASPYMGTTQTENYRTSLHSKENKFTEVPHTYGMWMVPPDIGVEVIIIFIGGDANRGYWLACVNSNLSRYMLPAIGSSKIYDGNTVASDIKKDIQMGQPVPVAEFNENDPATFNKPSLLNNPKPVHDPQYRILKEQGLDRDLTRGPISSSSQRETPSNVFGISTPGRPYDNDPANNPEEFLKKLADGTASANDYRVPTRVGGHSFVMDDGDAFGNDQLLRLRTSGGHQIMMHDSDNTIYVSHADGTSWVELTDEGAVNIYSANGFNVRSQGTINLHSDQNINLNAKNNIHMRATKIQADAGTINLLSSGNLGLESGWKTTLLAGRGLNVEAKSELTLTSSGQISLVGSSIKNNSSAGKSVDQLSSIFVNSLSDVSRKSSNDLYVSTSGVLKTIVTVAPTHEPYRRREPPVFQPVSATVSENPEVKLTGTKEKLVGLSKTSSKQVLPVADEILRLQPLAKCQIGNLTQEQLTAYFAQLGFRESGGTNPMRGLSNGEIGYRCVNFIGFIGKYQMGALAMIDLGYIKSDRRANRQMALPDSWTGKNGINNREDFLNSPEEQEAAACAYTKLNYDRLRKSGTITADMTPEELGGVLAVAHIQGSTGAKNFFLGQDVPPDALGTKPEEYQQLGKMAIAVVAPKMAEINAG